MASIMRDSQASEQHPIMRKITHFCVIVRERGWRYCRVLLFAAFSRLKEETVGSGTTHGGLP